MKKESQAGTKADKRTGDDNSASASVEANPMLSAALSYEEAAILIGEFMGKFDFSKAYCRSHGLPEYKPEEDLIEVRSFKYHSSWDWLMPACVKFDTLYDDKWTFDERMMYELLSDEMDKAATLYEILPLYNALIKGITWYNSVVSVGSR